MSRKSEDSSQRNFTSSIFVKLRGESQTRSINDDSLEFHVDPLSKKLVKDKRSAKEKAPEFVVKPRRQFVNEGETAKFKASFDGPAQTKLSWSKNGTTLTTDRQHKIYNDKEFHYLEISNTSAKNGGTYTCTIQNSAGSAQASAELEIYEKPSTKTSKSGIVAPEVDIPLTDAQYSPNDRNVTLECKFSNAVDATAKWYKDGAIQKSNFLAKQTFDGRLARLVFNKVTEKDGGVYECVVTSSGGEARSKAVITVAAPGSRSIPPKFVNPLSHQTLNVGDRLVLESKLTGYPRPIIKWLKDKEQIKSSTDLKLDFDGTTVKLTMSKVKATDSATYTCLAENSAGKDQIKATIDVKAADDFKEPPTFVRELHDFEADDGDRVELVVEVKGTPPFEIVWVHNDKEISTKDPNFKILAEKNIHKLIIPKFLSQYEGEFSCEAFNAYGDAETYCMLKCRSDNSLQNLDNSSKGNNSEKHYEDNDEVSPDFILRPRSVHVEEGNSAIFLCRGSGNPPPSVHWMKQGQIIENKGRYKILLGEDNMLEIKNVVIEDSGRYVCVLSNNSGSVSANVDLIVKKLSSHKGESAAVCRSGLSQGMREERLDQRNKEKSKVLDIDVTCKVQLDKPKGLIPENRMPSVSLNIKSPKNRRQNQENLDSRSNNHVLVMKSSSSIVQSTNKFTDNQPFSNSDSASNKCLNQNDVKQKSEKHLTETSSDKDMMFYKKSSDLKLDKLDKNDVRKTEFGTRLKDLKHGKDNQTSIRKTESNQRSDGKLEQLDFRKVLKKKENPITDGKIFDKKTKDEKDKIDFRSVLSSTTKTPVTQNSDKKELFQKDFRNVLRQNNKLPVNSVLEKKSKLTLDLSTRENKSDSVFTHGKIHQRNSSMPASSSEIMEKKQSNSVQSKEEIKKFESVKGDNLLDSTQTPKPVLNRGNPQDFRSVLSQRQNKETNKSENVKSPITAKQQDFRHVLKRHVEATCHQPPKFLSPLCDQSVHESESAILECKVGGFPIPEITWTVGRKEIKPSKFFRMTFEDSVARLIISGAYPEDEGKYTCTVTNSLGHVQCSCYLKVQELSTTSNDHTDEDVPSDTPSNQITDILTNQESDTSSNTLTNQISEKIENVQIISGKLTDKSTSEMSESGIDTLKDDISVESEKIIGDLKDIVRDSPCTTISQSEDEGFDDYPPDTSSGQAPQIHDISPARLKIKRGSEVKIQVSYTSDSPSVVRWYRNTTEIQSDEKYLIKTTEHFTHLQIFDVQRDDSGKYKVVSENSAGSDSALSTVTVEDVPDPPSEKPYASEINMKSVILSWSAPGQDGGCRVTSYKVEMCHAEDNIWQTLSSSCHSTSYQVENLRPYTPYFFRVSAQNKHGSSNPSETSDVVVPKERRLSTRLSFDSDDVFASTPSSSAISPFSTFPTPEEELPFSPRHVALSNERSFDDTYELKDHVGKGKFGNVYKCVEKVSSRLLAAKIIKCRAKEKQKVQKEIDIMNKLNKHPKLLMLWDAFETARTVTLVMEYVDGGELFERVVDEDFDLTERDAVYFMRQICEGVNYMQEQGIIHLDLKPENILCVHKDSNLVKIIDFGLARFHTASESVRVMYGTPEFIAPEVVNYEEIGFPTDIWSLGVICYVLLSGLSPFLGDNDSETLSNVTRGDFDFDDEAFDEISDYAKDFITSTLKKNINKRFNIKQCLEHRWLARAERNSSKKLRQSLRNLKNFMARRRWQTMGNAIRALGRMSSLPKQLKGEFSASDSSILSDSDNNSQSDMSTVPSSTSSTSRLNDDVTSQRQFELKIKDQDYEVHEDVFLEPIQNANSLKKTPQQIHESAEDFESNEKTEINSSSERTLESLFFIKEMVDCEAFKGDVVRFDVAINGDPQPHISWFLEDEEITSDSRHSITTNQNGECSLIIKNVSEDDEGEYSCRVKNTSGEIMCYAELIICGTGAF